MLYCYSNCNLNSHHHHHQLAYLYCMVEGSWLSDIVLWFLENENIYFFVKLQCNLFYFVREFSSIKKVLSNVFQ